MNITTLIYDLNGVVINTDKTILKNPELVRQQSPFSLIKPTVDFIASHSGSKKQYILSNFSKAEEFAFLPHYHPELMVHFDGVVVSAHVGLKKPDPAIYLHLLEKYNVRPEQALYFDDEITNINTAQQLGINAIFVYPTIDILAEAEKYLK